MYRALLPTRHRFTSLVGKVYSTPCSMSWIFPDVSYLLFLCATQCYPTITSVHEEYSCTLYLSALLKYFCLYRFFLLLKWYIQFFDCQTLLRFNKNADIVAKCQMNQLIRAKNFEIEHSLPIIVFELISMHRYTVK